MAFWRWISRATGIGYSPPDPPHQTDTFQRDLAATENLTRTARRVGIQLAIKNMDARVRLKFELADLERRLRAP